MLPGQVFILDQYTEQVVSVYKDLVSPQQSLILGPGFEVDSLPIILCTNGGSLVVEDIQVTGVHGRI